jgi:hypothetical protein
MIQVCVNLAHVQKVTKQPHQSTTIAKKMNENQNIGTHSRLKVPKSRDNAVSSCQEFSDRSNFCEKENN